jgi:hypothetical protein
VFGLAISTTRHPQNRFPHLQNSLELDDAVPVFVVSQDFVQMAGPERNPDPQIWDEFRGRDGIAELREALTNLGFRDGSLLRASAAQRFWRLLKATIDFWYGTQERNVDNTIALERQRPSWKKLEELAESIRVEAHRPPSAKEATEAITPAVKRVSNAALKALPTTKSSRR